MSTSAAPAPTAPGQPAGRPPPVALLDLLVAGWTARLVVVMAQLGLADALTEGPRTPAELAAAAAADADAIARVLRALAPAGVVASDEAGRYALTPIGACLSGEAPGSLRDLVLMVGEGWHEQAWDRLDDAVRTGHNAFEIAHEEAFFEYMDRRPEAASRFDAAMGTFAALTHAAIVDAYDFTDANVIVDVGGGNGTLLAAILARHRQARGVLLERPHVTDRARATLAEAGLQERVELVGGDFFTAVPHGGDIYILATVLHDWDDVDAVSVLRRLRAVMSAGDRLLIAEQLLPETDEPSFSKLLDIEMLVLSGGRERTAAHYAELLEAAGLRVDRVIATPTPTSVIEATLAN